MKLTIFQKIGYTSIDQVHKVWIESIIIIIIIIIMFGEALWSRVECWHDITKRVIHSGRLGQQSYAHDDILIRSTTCNCE